MMAETEMLLSKQTLSDEETHITLRNLAVELRKTGDQKAINLSCRAFLKIADEVDRVEKAIRKRYGELLQKVFRSETLTREEAQEFNKLADILSADH